MTNEKKQTALDAFVQNILKHDKNFLAFYRAEYEEAKQTQTEQIIESVTAGFDDGYNVGKFGKNAKFLNGKDYYNETYEGNK